MERIILSLLINAGARDGLYGLQLVERSHGELARGTVYVTLERMQAKGLVQSQREEKGPRISGIPRRLYQPTGYGVRVFRAWEKLQALSPHRLAA